MYRTMDEMMANGMELFAQSKLVTCVGVLWLIKLFSRVIPQVYRCLCLFLVPKHWNQIDFRHYGEWAAITGSTDGIGKAFAGELAKRGLNIILISRNEDKLRNTAKEIEQRYMTKTLCIQADFRNRECYSHIKQNLEGMNIAVLVNNVGMIRLKPGEYSSTDENLIWNEIDVNCGSASLMTRIVLPQMKQKRKGIIINLSSLSTAAGLPYMGLYGATKSYLNTFSITLQQEVEHYNIKVHCLIPGFVETNMVKHITFFNKMNPITKLFYPDPQTYVKSALNSLNEGFLITTGYWPHSLIELVVTSMPMKVRLKIVDYFRGLIMKFPNKDRRRAARNGC